MLNVLSSSTNSVLKIRQDQARIWKWKIIFLLLSLQRNLHKFITTNMFEVMHDAIYSIHKSIATLATIYQNPWLSHSKESLDPFNNRVCSITD